MAICLSENFDKEKHLYTLDFVKKLKGDNVNDLIEEIYKVLEESPFSTSIKDSEDIDNYKHSIEELIALLGDILKKDSPTKLVTKDINSIKKGLSQKLLPAPLTKAEQVISVVIEGTDLVKEEEINKMKYNKVLLSFYGQSNLSIDNWRIRNFENDLRTVTLFGNIGIVDNEFDLNNNIIDYQESQYLIIRNYLLKYHFTDLDSALFPLHYYTNSRFDPDIRIQTSNSLNTFTAMYNIINHLKQTDEFKTLLEKGWNDDIMNVSTITKEREFFKAVAAYLNLTYFNQTLKSSYTSFVTSNKQDMPIEVIVGENGKREYSYKYNILTGNSNAIKTWGIEDSDAIKLMSSFNKYIISGIPLYNIDEVDSRGLPKEQFGRLESKDFIGTIVKLIEVGTNLKGSPIKELFAKDCISLVRDSSLVDGALYRVFNALFGNTKEVKTSIINDLKSKGFDINNINILYSIYHTVFDKNNKKSWYNLENNYRKSGKGFRSRYNLVESIYGIICSNAALNYLNTTYNSETGEYETKVKEKYSINGTKFDIKNSINNYTQNRNDRKDLLTTYKLNQQEDKLSYSIKIGNSTYLVLPKSDGKKIINILSKKKANSFDYVIKELEKFNSINLNDIKVREEIINSTNGIYYEFKKLLNFIGDMLDIRFTNSVADLNELNLAMIGDKNFLKDMFISATRALVVNDIYYKFSEAKKTDGTSYVQTELVLYMKDTGDWTSVVSAQGYEANEYFDTTEIGNLLNVVYVNEPWITKLARVRAILAQDTVTSTITDLFGNKNPNMSPTYLNSTEEIKSLISISNASELSTAYLLFSLKRDAILNSTVTLEIQTDTFTPKQVKKFTQQELIYDAIINKFFIPLIKNNTVYTQCTTLSDKTKFIATLIDMEALGFPLGNKQINGIELENDVIKTYINTIGKAYENIYKNVLADYKKVFPELDSIEKINAALLGRIKVIVNGELTTINNEKALIRAVNLYNQSHPNDKVIAYKDLSYRVTKSGLAFNELLYDAATNLYANPSVLRSRFLLEKIRFLNGLTDNQVFFKVTPQLKNIVAKLFGKDYASEWIYTVYENGHNQEYLILAKKGDKNILWGQISENESIELNPLLNTYFLMDNLIGNNLRLASTGSEINHQIKALKSLDLKDKLLKLINISDNNKILNRQLNSILKLTGLNKSDNLTFYDLNIIRNKLGGLISTNPEYSELYQKVDFLYNDLLYAMENLGQNALFKRNVIMSATITKIVPSLEGITDTMKIACIDDIKAEVFNFSGEHKGIEAHDGSAFVCAFWSILENKSLGSNEVGDIKKPIHHAYNDKYMTATLLKYATNTITNNRMRQSIGNDLNDTNHAINLYHLFKKMSNIRWHDFEGNWVDGEIDLVKGCGFRKDGRINFKRDILEQDINENNDLYYNKGGQHIKICDFGVENGIYYTIEQAFNTSPTDMSGKATKVYHYFDNNGLHFPSDHILSAAERITPEHALHTIDSLFELHTTLGGIWSERWNGKNYEYSEGSTTAVVNFINNVTIFKTKEGEDPKVEKARREDISIANYDLPLKRAMIHMIANNSAVKNGVGNINPTTSWYDDSELSYVTISTNNYGIQQDSDHTADEAHMTEFSLVISSLDAGGYLHDYVSQIYELLGLIALELANVELEAVKNFRETGDKSVLYDVLGRTIMANLRNGNGSIGLAEAIISNIKKRFNLNTNHALDSLKIPFSDPNIYSLIISTFVSNLNKKSIKRQYPGLGTVMAPSYNMSMIFDININGKYQQYQFTDLVKLARSRNIISEYTDVTKANQNIVKQLLRQELDKLSPEKSVSCFLPTENVLVKFETVNKKGNRELAEAHISFKGALDYYAFQDNPLSYLLNKGYAVLADSTLEFFKDLTVPRNLAPVRIEFDIEIKEGSGTRVVHTNIFNSWRIKNQIIELEKLDNQLKNKEITKEQYKLESDKVRKKYNVDSVFMNLKKGLFELMDGTMVSVTNLKNLPAEIIMSNLYKTKFGIKSGDSLVDILAAGKKYFDIPKLEVLSDTYDLAFTRGTGEHLFLTFKPLQKNTDTFKSRSKSWENESKKTWNRKYEIAADSPEVVNEVYATTFDNIRLFEIGREIINESVTWDSDLNCFVKNGKKVDNLKNFRRRGNDVLEYIEFVTQHEVTETFENGVKKTYTLYNINRLNIARCLEYKKEYTETELTRYKINKENKKETYKISEADKRNEEINDFISKLLYDIYCTDSFAGVDVNTSLSSGSRAVLHNSLRNFADRLNFDSELLKHIYKLLNKIHESKINKETGVYEIKGVDTLRTLFYQKMRDKLYTSFKKSLEITASRIPAQTLQSFMKMMTVGFTGTDTGLCYVTAWLTWLQGSDYDIDKAYIMGLSFDTNGKYIGWSNLFNYSSIATLEASEKLPMPKNILHIRITDIGKTRIKLRELLAMAIENEDIENLKKYTFWIQLLENTIDIDEDIAKIEKAEKNNNQVEALNLYANLINKLNKKVYEDGDLKKVNISFTNEYGRNVLSKLKIHEETKLPPILSLEVSKNFISSHIQNTIQDLVNMTRAYSPIDMEVFRDASNLSDKGNQSSKLTLLNPYCKFIMQYLNMTGKNVIGISANGEKGSFMWHYYLNDLIKHGTPKEREMGHFLFSTKRIMGRAALKLGIGEITPITITGLPDLNMDNIDPRIISEFGTRITGNLYVDLMISLVLSAATDNAKELILAKVNAGSKLAKMYLFMITMGFNINDIVAFMTSPVAEFIDKITEQDIFNNINLSLNDAIKLARGEFLDEKGNIKSYWIKRTDSKIKMEMIKDLYFRLGLGIKNNLELSKEEKEAHLNEINADIDEFENILEGADEFSNFAGFLGMNQGIKTSKLELQKFENRVKGYFTSRLEKAEKSFPKEKYQALKDEIGDFDVKRWFSDAEYRDKVAKVYNSIKKCINIFDAFTRIPQFDAIRKLYDVVAVVDNQSSIKAAAFNECIDHLMNSGYTYISETYLNNILKQIDNCIISKYIQEANLLIPIKKGYNILHSDGAFIKCAKTSDYAIKDRASIATFKYLMESTIIPGLKKGEVTILDKNGNIETKKILGLQENAFITSLKSTTELNSYFYKNQLNMLTIKLSLDSQRKYQQMVAGLREMNSIQVTPNMTLTDMFMLYNLIIHKNLYGASRMTSLFDPIVSSNNTSFLSKYLKWLGQLDYEGKPHLNTKEAPKVALILELNLEDIYRLAAPLVKSEKSLTDYYIKMLNKDKVIELWKNTGGKGKYVKVSNWIERHPNEDEIKYIERILNQSKYFTLGGQYSDKIERQLNILQELSDPEKVISCLNSFIKQGLLLIKKVCE